MGRLRRGGLKNKTKSLVTQLRILQQMLSEESSNKPQETSVNAICNDNLTDDKSDNYKAESIQRVNDELLINTIKKYPHLYNSSLKEYNDKNLEENSWGEIALIMNMSIESCQNQWIRLCEWFSEEQQFQKTETQNDSDTTCRVAFPLYNNMLFLENCIKQGEADINMTSPAVKELIDVSSISFHSINMNASNIYLYHQIISNNLLFLYNYMKERRENANTTKTTMKQESTNISSTSSHNRKKNLPTIPNNPLWYQTIFNNILFLKEHIEQKKIDTNMKNPTVKQEFFDAPSTSFHSINRDKKKIPSWKQLISDNKPFLRKHSFYESYTNTINPSVEKESVEKELIDTPSISSHNLDMDTDNIPLRDQTIPSTILSNSDLNSLSCISPNLSKENNISQAEDVVKPNTQLSLSQCAPTHMNQVNISISVPNDIPQNTVVNQPSQQNIAKLDHSTFDSTFCQLLTTELANLPEHEKSMRKQAIMDILQKL